MLIIVVRYFGGTLLGVPGLINAYRSAASMALQIVPAVRKEVLKYWAIQFDYTQINEVLTLMKQFNCLVIAQDHQLFSSIKFGISSVREKDAMTTLYKLRNFEISEIK